MFQCGPMLLLAGCSALGSTSQGTGALGVNIADAALDGGMPQTALNVTRTILQSDPRNVGALVRQGAALAELNQPDAAMEAYRRVLAVDPAAAAAPLGLGRLELARGSASDAEHDFTQLLARAPDDKAAMNDLGVALDPKGDHAAAQGVYEKLLRIDPNDRGASVNLALSLSLSGPVRGDAAWPRLAARCDAACAPGPGGGSGVVGQDARGGKVAAHRSLARRCRGSGGGVRGPRCKNQMTEMRVTQVGALAGALRC